MAERSGAKLADWFTTSASAITKATNHGEPEALAVHPNLTCNNTMNKITTMDFPRVIQEMHGESAMLEQELAKVTKQFGNLHEALTRIDSECRKPEPHLPTIIAAASVALLRVKEEPEV